MKMTRTIPARKETIEILWSRKFQNYGIHKSARDKMNMRTNKRCYWCRKTFQPEDSTWLVSIIGKGNHLFCEDCGRLAAEDTTSKVTE